MRRSRKETLIGGLFAFGVAAMVLAVVLMDNHMHLPFVADNAPVVTSAPGPPQIVELHDTDVSRGEGSFVAPDAGVPDPREQVPPVVVAENMPEETPETPEGDAENPLVRWFRAIFSTGQVARVGVNQGN